MSRRKNTPSLGADDLELDDDSDLDLELRGDLKSAFLLWKMGRAKLPPRVDPTAGGSPLPPSHANREPAALPTGGSSSGATLIHSTQRDSGARAGVGLGLDGEESAEDLGINGADPRRRPQAPPPPSVRPGKEAAGVVAAARKGSGGVVEAAMEGGGGVVGSHGVEQGRRRRLVRREEREPPNMGSGGRQPQNVERVAGATGGATLPFCSAFWGWRC